ncbi:lycopene cyclase family protein [Streptomyces sp. NPDC002394]
MRCDVATIGAGEAGLSPAWRPLPPSRVRLLQHFKAWFLRSEHPAFAADTVDLMDFRTPQPPQGLSFGYVLPLSRHEALVEYTEFSREPPTRRPTRRGLCSDTAKESVV